MQRTLPFSAVCLQAGGEVNEFVVQSRAATDAALLSNRATNEIHEQKVPRPRLQSHMHNSQEKLGSPRWVQETCAGRVKAMQSFPSIEISKIEIHHLTTPEAWFHSICSTSFLKVFQHV